MDADDAGVGASRAVLQGVGHDVAVVLLPEPALRRHVRRAHQRQDGGFPVGRRRHAGRVEPRLQDWCGPGPVIERGVIEQRRQRHIADGLALVFQHQVTRVGGPADGRRVQAPLGEDALAVGLAAGLEDRQHPLLAFREHHLVGRHAFFALWHVIEVELDADAPLAGHLDRGGGETRRAHVLDRGHGARRHQLQRRLDQQLFGEGVADLNGGALFVGGVVELLAGHGGAMDPVAAGLGAEVDHRKAGGRRGRVEDLVGVGQADAHGVDQDVAVVAAMEVGLAGHGRHAHAIAIAADAADHAGHQALGLGMAGIAEAQRVEQRDRPRAHGEDIPHDAADPGRGALVGLDVRGVVVALHLEDAGQLLPVGAVADVDDAGVLARTADHARPGGGEFAQVDLAGFVGTVLRPHHRKDAQLDGQGLAVQALDDDVILGGAEAIFSGRFGHGLGRRDAHAALLAGLAR